MTTKGKYLEQAPPSITKVAPDGSGANPPIAPETPQEEGWWKKASPWVHGTLGAVSFIPGASIVSGAADAAIYAAEGEMIEAGIAAASMIPGGKIVTTVGKVAKTAVTAAKEVSAASKIVKGAHEAEEMAKAAKALKEAEEAAATKLAKEAEEAERLKKAEQEAQAAQKGERKPGEGKTKDNVNVKGKQHKVPCFHPFDKKKFMRMSKEDQKAYLKELAKQLKGQEDAINSLTAAEFKTARDAFKAAGRNAAADTAQGNMRDAAARTIKGKIFSGLEGKMGVAEAKKLAATKTEEIMSKLAALHEPDMVAGGWSGHEPKGMGRSDVNSSIGGSWNQKGRVSGMDSAADDAIKKGKGDQKMNVKLEPCRGKGLK